MKIEALQALQKVIPFHFRVGNGIGKFTKQGNRKIYEKYSVLAYVNARDLMDKLDEVCGPHNRQRRYNTHGQTPYCEVGIKIENERVWKSDCGEKTRIASEKGESSDAFKRACVNWGLGRFLYTIPFLTITQQESKERNLTALIRKKHEKVLLAWAKNYNAKIEDSKYGDGDEVDLPGEEIDQDEWHRKAKIDEIQTLEELEKFYYENKGKGKEFNQYVLDRKTELQGRSTT